MWNGAERRKFVRANFPCKITIYAGHEFTISTHTENISAGGVKVVIEEKLDASTFVGLELYLEERPIVCKGRIAWVLEKKSPYQDRFVFYDTGIEFYEIKSDDRQVIKDFVDKIVS